MECDHKTNAKNCARLGRGWEQAKIQQSAIGDDDGKYHTPGGLLTMTWRCSRTSSSDSNTLIYRSNFPLLKVSITENLLCLSCIDFSVVERNGHRPDIEVFSRQFLEREVPC